MNRGRIQEFTGTEMVCPCSMMSVAPSWKTQLTQETICRDVGGRVAEMGMKQDIRWCAHWLFWLLSRDDGQAWIYLGPSRVVCRQHLLQKTVPPWYDVASEWCHITAPKITTHFIKKGQFWCGVYFPSDRVILVRSVWKGDVFLAYLESLSSKAVCMPLSFAKLCWPL